MKFAAAVNEKNPKAIIPLTLEEATGLMIFETDTMDILDYVAERERWVDQMNAYKVEAILCGDIYDAPMFEAIAGAGITRFYAANLSVRKAVKKESDNELDLIRDYVGGTGCKEH